MLPKPVALLVASLLLLTACSNGQDESAGSSAEEFLSSAAEGDGTRACDVLSPSTRSELVQSSGKPCEQAILEEHLTIGTMHGIDVFDTMAVAHIGSETVFLSRFDSRWMVIAAACTAVPERPYDCAIKGA
jgi:hypothetical protein